MGKVQARWKRRIDLDRIRLGNIGDFDTHGRSVVCVGVGSSLH